MSRDPTDLPPRLIAGEATEFERRVIDSALERRPSAAASARMARALGVTVTTLGTAATAKALAAETASKASSGAVASTTSTLWPWISAGVVGLAVAGAVVGLRAHHRTSPMTGSTVLPPAVTAPASPVPVPGPGAAALLDTPSSSLASAPERPIHHGRAAAPGGDVREEIAVLDTARAALSAGDAHQALNIVRRYETKYAAGSFRPEASAIKIEALLKIGREAEARDLARRFVAEQRGTFLAKRVAELAGLTASSSSQRQ